MQSRSGGKPPVIGGSRVKAADDAQASQGLMAFLRSHTTSALSPKPGTKAGPGEVRSVAWIMSLL